jgi:hypothetical protein
VRDNKIINHKLFKFVIKKRFVASFDTFFRTQTKIVVRKRGP